MIDLNAYGLGKLRTMMLENNLSRGTELQGMSKDAMVQALSGAGLNQVGAVRNTPTAVAPDRNTNTTVEQYGLNRGESTLLNPNVGSGGTANVVSRMLGALSMPGANGVIPGYGVAPGLEGWNEGWNDGIRGEYRGYRGYLNANYPGGYDAWANQYFGQGGYRDTAQSGGGAVTPITNTSGSRIGANYAASQRPVQQPTPGYGTTGNTPEPNPYVNSGTQTAPGVMPQAPSPSASGNGAQNPLWSFMSQLGGQQYNTGMFGGFNPMFGGMPSYGGMGGYGQSYGGYGGMGGFGGMPFMTTPLYGGYMPAMYSPNFFGGGMMGGMGGYQAMPYRSPYRSPFNNMGAPGLARPM